MRPVKFDKRVRLCVAAPSSSSRLTVKQKRAVPIADEFRFDVVENFLLQLREIHGDAPELRPRFGGVVVYFMSTDWQFNTCVKHEP